MIEVLQNRARPLGLKVVCPRRGALELHYEGRMVFLGRGFEKLSSFLDGFEIARKIWRPNGV
jgi:hypothetical protein